MGDPQTALFTSYPPSVLHDEVPEIGIEDRRWGELVERADHRPICMLNFRRFRTAATYPEEHDDASGQIGSISGVLESHLYSSMAPKPRFYSLSAVPLRGRRLFLSGSPGAPLARADANASAAPGSRHGAG